jgi:AAHS family 4-hydroxybenzoate transporter-like MFS transporter
MKDSKVIDVGELIDAQPLRPFHVYLAAILFLFMISDGYDLQVMGFAAPGVVKMLHIDRSALGPVLSASLFGMLFGAPLFGWIGDRFGRRPSLLGGLATFGLVSLLTAAAHDRTELLILRFVTGLGLGGVPANSVALMAEYAPKRMRATLIVIAQTGLTVGSIMPAVVSGALEGAMGWRPLFVVGGLAPLIIAAVGLFALPESLKFLVARGAPQERQWRMARRLDPSLRAETGGSLVLSQSTGVKRFQLARLFGADLVGFTAMIWIVYIAFLSANYFMHGWIPILFRDEGLSIRRTAFTASMFDVGGIVGALIASRLVDRFGVATIVGLFLVAIPAVSVIGLIGPSVTLLSTAIFISGFCLVGITLSMAAVTGVVYPTEIRANGLGWANGIGRFASILSPLVGGWLIGMKLPISQLFLVPAAPMVVGAFACFQLMRLCLRRYRGPRLFAQ